MKLYSRPKVIAEVGCNHRGSFETAKELVALSKHCGADVVKFQKRCPKELLTEEQYNSPHPNGFHAYGDTYGAHREFLELDFQQHKALKDYCKEIDIEYSTSVWDVTSAREIIKLGPKLIKVPSACNTHFEMLKTLRDTYQGEVHVSTGMSTKTEVEEVVTFFNKGVDSEASKKRLVMYACTSGYPVPFEDVCLLEILNLKERFSAEIKALAFSGHHAGISVDIAAYTLGAEWIERHFTKNRTWKGSDHAASLEQSGLTKLVRNLDCVHQALKYKHKEILDIESVQRKKLKFRKE